MSVPAHQAVVTSRNGPWATLRVRGLLRNAALAARLASAGADSIEIRLDTGSVRVRLSKQRAETFWIEWLSATVEAHFVAKPPAPPPVGRRQRPAVRRPRAPESSTAADKAATGGTDRTHSTPITRLLADLGDDRPIDVEQGLTSAQGRARLARDGPNEIRDITGRSTAQILLGQFRSVPVALLGGSAGLALATRAYVDAGAIGAVLAARAGMDIAVHSARASAAAEQALREVRDVTRPGQKVVLVPADLERQDQAQGLVQEVEAGLGPLDVLVNNTVSSMCRPWNSSAMTAGTR